MIRCSQTPEDNSGWPKGLIVGSYYTYVNCLVLACPHLLAAKGPVTRSTAPSPGLRCPGASSSSFCCLGQWTVAVRFFPLLSCFDFGHRRPALAHTRGYKKSALPVRLALATSSPPRPQNFSTRILCSFPSSFIAAWLVHLSTPSQLQPTCSHGSSLQCHAGSPPLHDTASVSAAPAVLGPPVYIVSCSVRLASSLRL